tara:strand:- start:1780 stop:2010 length:231 start_codon:yes stop_codon:yes gene_type:complete
MIPIAYLDVGSRGFKQINPSSKSGESTNKNYYTKSRNSAKSLKNIDIGPAVVLHLGEDAKQEPMCAYDFLGRPKKM